MHQEKFFRRWKTLFYCVVVVFSGAFCFQLFGCSGPEGPLEWPSLDASQSTPDSGRQSQPDNTTGQPDNNSSQPDNNTTQPDLPGAPDVNEDNNCPGKKPQCMTDDCLKIRHHPNGDTMYAVCKDTKWICSAGKGMSDKACCDKWDKVKCIICECKCKTGKLRLEVCENEANCYPIECKDNCDFACAKQKP